MKTRVGLFLISLFALLGCDSPVTQSQNQVATQNPQSCHPIAIPDCPQGTVNFACDGEIVFSQSASCDDCPKMTGCEEAMLIDQ